jgi:hypothetical protein
MSNLLRRSNGQPIRDAMRARGLTGPELATLTREVDVTGRGISPAAVGRLAGKGRTSADSCRLRTAWLIADVLDEPLQRLFAMPSVSTDTVERSRPDEQDHR